MYKQSAWKQELPVMEEPPGEQSTTLLGENRGPGEKQL